MQELQHIGSIKDLRSKTWYGVNTDTEGGQRECPRENVMAFIRQEQSKLPVIMRFPHKKTDIRKAGFDFEIPPPDDLSPRDSEQLRPPGYFGCLVNFDQRQPALKQKEKTKERLLPFVTTYRSPSGTRF